MENSPKESIKRPTHPNSYYIGRVQHNYVFFAPKIIKFCYPPNPNIQPPSTPPKHHVTARPTPKKQASFKKITLVCRQEKKKRERTNKITLVSRTTQRSELRVDDSILSISKRQSQSKSSQIIRSRYMKTEHNYTYALPDHIKLEPLLPSVSCDLFSNCNEAEILQKETLSLHHHKKKAKVEQGEKQHRFTNNRKRIFMNDADKLLNKSVDVCRSKSRRSIFAPLQRHSFSMQRSVSVRKKIFLKRDCPSNKRIVTKMEVQIDQNDIPDFVKMSWEQISQQNEGLYDEISSHRPSRMVQSQVVRI